MGSSIQEVLRRRGGQERQRYAIKRAFFIVSLLTLSILLYYRYPSTDPPLWFISAGLVFFSIIYFSFIREDKRVYPELMLFIPIFISAVSQYLGKSWIQFFVLPYIMYLGFNVRLKDVLLVSFVVPLINIDKFVHYKTDPSIIFFYAVVLTTAMSAAWFFNRLKKDKDAMETSLASIKAGVKEAAAEPVSLKDETLMTNYFSALLETDKELKNVLHVVGTSLYADSVTFFEMNSSGKLTPRCGTEPERSIIMTGGGMLSTAFSTGRSLIINDVKSKKIDVGYIRRDEFDSAIIACVADEGYATGVVAVDSDRYRAFNQSDILKLDGFAAIIKRIIKRGRIYPQIKLSHDGLKTLQQESFHLISTLNIDEICEKIVEGMHKIAGGPAVLFLKKGRTYVVAGSRGLIIPEKKEYMVGDTLLDLCVKNKERFYLSDLSLFKKKVLPFPVNGLSSIVCLPMIYEESILGIMAVVSDKKNAFNSYQMELLDVMINQASVSMANARLHHEIKQMAVTDGLTGLYNHRYFQERLDDEFKRLSRNRVPISLILTDIDFFKKVNDTYGHPAGDAVLKGVSAIISYTIREVDFAARYGGEEFALILTNTDFKGAKVIAERLRKSVLKTEFPVDGKILKVSISLGISSLSDNASSKEELIEKADKALYFAKKSGRNRSVLWSEVKG